MEPRICPSAYSDSFLTSKMFRLRLVSLPSSSRIEASSSTSMYLIELDISPGKYTAELSVQFVQYGVSLLKSAVVAAVVGKLTDVTVQLRIKHF